MSETSTERPTNDERPTGPEVPLGGASKGPAPAPPPRAQARVVLARGARIPWPRRLIAAGLLSAVLALALHALPRPYQSLPTGVVRGLGDGYGNLRSTYKNEVAVQEPVAGEADAADRKAYARELWRYRWFGAFREILLRFAEWLAASCMLIALSMIAVERRRSQRELAAKSAPTLLRHETLAGDPLPPPAIAETAAPRQMEPLFDAPATPVPVTRAVPLRETGDEVTPPSATPIPPIPPAALELRAAIVPAPFDDDDLGRVTENQAPNLAKRAVASTAAATPPAGPAGLPVFFAERRHPDPHPVVHPGDAPPPAEPAPTPMPVSGPVVLAEPATPAPTPVMPSGSSTPPPITPAPPANDNPGWWPKRGE